MRRLVLLVAVLILAACSDSDQTSSQRASPAPATGSQAARATAQASGAASGQGQRAAANPPRRAPATRQFDPSAFTLGLEQVAGGFRNPLYVTSAGDGSGRLFVVEQGGTIRIIQNGQVLPQPFLDVASRIKAGGEQGLLGLVFHPRYSENGRFFINYTAGNGDNTVAEFHVSSDPNRADPNSGRVLYAIPDFAPNHNAGMLAFGPDSYLYAGTGDGGGGGDPQRNGQNLGAMLGKMLRLDVDNGSPYGIPSDNPFVGRGDARPEIWAYGLRNPWRFSFDRATGDLWIADVGQGSWEEVDFQPAGSRGGENYGWSVMEGTHCFRPSNGCDTSGIVLPVTEYDHDQGCSVTGGFVYRGAANPSLYGAYIYGDYCSGRIWALYQSGGSWQSTELLKQDARISSFGEDEAGEMYMTGYSNGVVYRLTTVQR